MIAAYVQSIDGRPLMPVRHYGRVRRMIASGKARIVNTLPFTIRLTYILAEEHTQRILLGNDPGRTNLGLCAINAKGQILYVSDIETRNKMIAKLMLARKQARQASRRGERLRRQRRARKNRTQMVTKTALGIRPVGGRMLWERILPRCEKPVPVHDIRNTEARFCHRKRKSGWLTPTANQLLQTHINGLNKTMKLLPVTDIVVELNKFAFARMDNLDIKGKEYQMGPMHGFLTIREALNAEQDGHCMFCKRPIQHDHHILPKSKGGTDSLKNRAGLCKIHHDLVHRETEWYDKMVARKAGINKKYGALSTLNQIIPHYWDYLQQIEPWVYIHATNGWTTKKLREEMGLEKDHAIDAWCIAVSILEDPESLEKPVFDQIYHIKQYRRHDRAIICRTESRKYYLNGELVATNRHKAVAAIPKRQKDGTVVYEEKAQFQDSLEEFRKKMTELHGEKEAERIIGSLMVKKSRRCYNNRSRLMPGATLETKDCRRFVMHSQHNNGERYAEEIPRVAAAKEKLAAAKKELSAEKKKKADTSALEEQVKCLEKAIPKYPEHQSHACRTILHNSGLVYIPDNKKQ